MGKEYVKPVLYHSVYLTSMQRSCCSVSQSCPTLCNPMDCSMQGLPVPHHLLVSAQVNLHCISDVIQPSHLMPSSYSALDLSQQQRLLQRVICSHQMTKYWSFSFSISPTNEYSRLISLKIDWLDLLAFQGTLKCLLQLQTFSKRFMQFSSWEGLFPPSDG